MLKGLERMKLRCNGLRFTVKEEAKIVVCSGDFVCRQTGKNYHVHAVAKTDDVDAFNEAIGKRLARARCEHKAYMRFRNDIRNMQREAKRHLEIITNTLDMVCLHRLPVQRGYIKSLTKK